MVALALEASSGTGAACLWLRNGAADLDGEARHGLGTGDLVAGQ